MHRLISGVNVSSSLLDADSNSFGIFTAIRDEHGSVVDLRVEYLKSAGPGTSSQRFSMRLSEMPDLMEIGLLEHCRLIVDGPEPVAGTSPWRDLQSHDSRRFAVRAIQLGDGCFAQWREAMLQSPNEELAETGDADPISALAAANRRLQNSETNLRLITETLERRVAERTAESSARAEQLRFLALSLADAESRERKRLGQLLHDDLQQLVSAAKLKAGLIRRSIAQSDIVKESLLEVERLLEDAIGASRSLSNELSPPVLHDAGLGAAVETIARAVQNRNKLKITVQCDPRAEPELEQVRALLFENIRELLKNIVEHAQATSVQIITGLTDQQAIEIRVSDDGHGFDIATLLEPASRTDRPFGLMEMRERLSYLGCTLTIRSELGKGTDVRIVAPVALRPLADEISGPLPSLIQKRNQSMASAMRGRMLVADDHAIFRNGLVNLLKHEPTLEVVGEAADGEQTVALARSLQPDILLLDITMPKLSGVQVANQLSKEMPGLKIVGLSMHDRQDMASAMRAAGAIAYFTKGGSWEVLLSFLRSLVSRAEAK